GGRTAGTLGKGGSIWEERAGDGEEFFQSARKCAKSTDAPAARAGSISPDAAASSMVGVERIPHGLRTRINTARYNREQRVARRAEAAERIILSSPHLCSLFSYRVDPRTQSA